MSALYPLVRNLYAFSTRFGVSRSPSRDGSSPRPFSSVVIASCILPFYLSVAAAHPRDVLYAARPNPASARRAADLWASALAADPRNTEAAWKLARADY